MGPIPDTKFKKSSLWVYSVIPIKTVLMIMVMTTMRMLLLATIYGYYFLPPTRTHPAPTPHPHSTHPAPTPHPPAWVNQRVSGRRLLHWVTRLQEGEKVSMMLMLAVIWWSSNTGESSCFPRYRHWLMGNITWKVHPKLFENKTFISMTWHLFKMWTQKSFVSIFSGLWQSGVVQRDRISRFIFLF